MSGGVIVGIVFGSSEVSKVRPSLSAYFPDTWSKREACLQSKSLDGKYQSLRNLIVPGPWPHFEIAEIEYQTKYSEFLKNSIDDNFALLISTGNCAEESSEYVASYWNSETPDKWEEIRIMVNSLGGDQVYVFPGFDPGVEAVVCKRTDDLNSRSYDHVCIIKSDALSGERTEFELNIVRAGTSDQAVFFTIVAPEHED